MAQLARPLGMVSVRMTILLALLKTADGSSAETLKALAELVKAAQTPSHAGGSPWLSPDGLRAITGLITAIAWPAIVVFALIAFRTQVVSIAGRLQEFEFLGVKGKIEGQLKASAAAAEQAQGLSPAPTAGEISRSIQVEKLTTGADLSIMRQQVDTLALEYERVRASMRPSDERTRAMEVVVAKMRTIGRAAYPLRYELMPSPSPGKRLQAIACLQVMPDFELLDWLAQRLGNERPFIEYHALVAMNEAATDPRAKACIPQLEAALGAAKPLRLGRTPDREREKLLVRFEERVTALKGAVAT